VKTKPVQDRRGLPQIAMPKPTSRIAAVRRIEPGRPLRVWSLLLGPSFPPDPK
jgi:hypothetical protein